MTKAISLSDVSKHYGGSKNAEQITAVDLVSLTIEPHSITGIVGRNGCGKSTLLKMIAGIIKPTSGKVETCGNVLALTDVGAGFHPDLTGRENIYMVGRLYGLKKLEIDTLYPQVLEFSELKNFMNTRMKNYSQGMFLRLAFALMIHLPLNIVLIDEVLGVGDEAFRLKCYDKIRMLSRLGLTIVLVSHNFEEIAALCSRCIVMEKGQIIADGNPQDVYNKYSQSLNMSEKNNVNTSLSFQIVNEGIVKIESVKIENAVNPEFDIDFVNPILIILNWEKYEDRGAVFFDLLLSDLVGTPFFATANFYGNDIEKITLPNTGIKGKFKTVFTIPPFFLNYGIIRVYLNGSIFYSKSEYSTIFLTAAPITINILNSPSITQKHNWFHSPAPIKTMVQWAEIPN